MPLFEYRCADCQRDFEVLVRRGEAITCPECGQEDVQKLFSAHASPSGDNSLPISGGCDSSLPPCRPGCCRM